MSEKVITQQDFINLIKKMRDKQHVLHVGMYSVHGQGDYGSTCKVAGYGQAIIDMAWELLNSHGFDEAYKYTDHEVYDPAKKEINNA